MSEDLTNSVGAALPLLRDPATGQFVEIAKRIVVKNAPLVPLIGANPPVGLAIMAANMGLEVGNIYQTHKGFKAVLGQLSTIQSTLGVLQTTTAFIGVGVATTAVLSAVNLWQTLKLRQDVKQLRLEVQDGFLDLKKALKNQEAEIIQHLDQVAQDITFQQHRLELVKAYGRFIQATNLIKTAMKMQDFHGRTVELANARQTLGEALAIYRNQQILSKASAPAQLRRFECAWAIEQAIVLCYQLQEEPEALSHHLSQFQSTIRQDSLQVIDSCETEDELDFLFPELTRIHDHDLAALTAWQNQVDWMASLPPDEVKLLASSDFLTSEMSVDSEADFSLTEPPEMLLYQQLKEKSHPPSLAEQLKFLMDPKLREQAELYISQNSTAFGYKNLNIRNLQKASNFAVANLYFYFSVRDESEKEEQAS